MSPKNIQKTIMLDVIEKEKNQPEKHVYLWLDDKEQAKAFMEQQFNEKKAYYQDKIVEDNLNLMDANIRLDNETVYIWVIVDYQKDLADAIGALYHRVLQMVLNQDKCICDVRDVIHAKVWYEIDGKTHCYMISFA